MKYEQARELIQDGDLIAVKSRHGGLVALTRLVTRSPYTHTAVALWLDGGLWVAEMGFDGNHLVPLSHHAGKGFEVFDCPIERATLRKWVTEVMREPLEYDLLDLLRIACNRILGVALAGDGGGRVCSAFSASIYLWAGWPARGLPSIPAPDDVVRALGGAPKLTVEA